MLGEVTEEHCERHLVEAELAFDAERPIQIEGQFDDRQDDGEDGDESNAARDAAVEKGCGNIVDGLQAPAKGQDEQYGGIEDHGFHVESRLRTAVVGGFLMGVEADIARKRGRNRAAIGLDVPYMACCEPQTQSGGAQQCGKKKYGETVHGCWSGSMTK